MSGLRVLGLVWGRNLVGLLLCSFPDLGGVSEFRRLLFYLCFADSVFGWFGSGWVVTLWFL